MASDQSLHTTYKQLEHRRSTLSTLENEVLPTIGVGGSGRAFSPVFMRPKSNWVSVFSLAD